jgi:hypothetical protein
MFLSGFFFWWGIGASIALFWLIIRYGVPLVMLFVVTVCNILKIWKDAFMEGWNETGDRK